MQNNGKDQSVFDTLDVGVLALEHLLESLSSKGLDFDMGSSALAVAVAGILTREGITVDNFLSLVNETLKLWRMENGESGPVLVFSTPLFAGSPQAGDGN